MDSSSLSYRSCENYLHSHCWDERCVVYHPGSGDTHLLNKVDLSVLQRINEKPTSAKDLSVEFEWIFDDGAVQYIQILLSNLAELGLIEVVKNESDN